LEMLGNAWSPYPGVHCHLEMPAWSPYIVGVHMLLNKENWQEASHFKTKARILTATLGHASLPAQVRVHRSTTHQDHSSISFCKRGNKRS
jgi:hypothetical protein